MTAGEKIRDAAYSWLGTPYEGCAKVKGVGVDCGQLLIAAVEDAGLIQRGTVQTGTYSQEWHLHRSEEKYLSFIERYCEPVTGEPQPGDFALYKFGRCISHGAIVDVWPRVIHAYVRLGVIMSDNDEALLLDGRGRTRLAGIWRFKA